MGEVNRLKGTLRGGQFHVGAHRWPLGYTPAYQAGRSVPASVGSGHQPSHQHGFAAAGTGAGSEPERPLHPISCAASGWYDEPLTVVHQGEDAPHRGERLFVGLQNARLYNGNERIEPREELALAESA